MKRLILALLILVSPAFAATHYVYSGATGTATGANWTNAFTALPATLVRGDTYVLAGGTYGAYTFNTAGTTPMLIRKATSALDSGVTGWVSTFATNTAFFIQWNEGSSSGGNYTLNGETGTFNGTALPTYGSLGICLSGNNSCTSGASTTCQTGSLSRCVQLDGGTGSNFQNVTFSYVEIQGMGATSAQNTNNPDDLVYYGGSSGLTLDHSFFHDSSCDFTFGYGSTNLTVQYSYFYKNWGAGACHGQVSWNGSTNTNPTWKFNTFRTIEGTAIITAATAGGGTTLSGLTMYGNTFYWGGNADKTGYECLGNGIISCVNSGVACSSVKFYNNTIVGFPANNSGGGPAGCGASGAGFYDDGSATWSGLDARNNIYYGNQTSSTAAAAITGVTQTFISYLNNSDSVSGTGNVINGSAGNPFVTWAGSGNLNAQLSADTSNVNNWTTLASPFNVDPLGVTRTTDRGAFQFVAAHTTWYVRSDGGTRTQCTGTTDAAYPGSGSGQACGFNDARWLWDNQAGTIAWIIAGGDTVLFESAASISAVSGLVAASTGPPNRIGWDYGGPCSGAGCGAGFTWCQGVGSSCGMPPPPAGTPSAPTHLWGANHGACSTTTVFPGAVTSGGTSAAIATIIPDATKMFEMYGDFGNNTVVDFRGTHDIDMQCIHITTHGTCIIHASTSASPTGPNPCSTSTPLSSYASEGIRSTTGTTGISLTDVWISGMQDSGWFGPITGTVNFNDVRFSYNVMTGFNMDDDSVHTQTGGTVNGSYVTIDFNGFSQSWPFTTAVPVGYLSTQSTGGDGDGCATPGSSFDTFNFDHMTAIYNGQDGCDVGHNQDPGSAHWTTSIMYGNLGGTFKSGGESMSMINSYSMQNCFRVQAGITGVPSTATSWNSLNDFDYCRAGDGVGVNWLGGGSGEVINIQNSTIITYGNGVDFNIQGTGTCTGCTFNFQNNLALAYSNPNITSGHNPVMFTSSTSVSPTQVDHNNVYNFFGYSAGTGDIVTNTNLTGQPNPATPVGNSFGDAFNFTPTSSTPGNASAPRISGITTDIFGTSRPNPTSMGDVQFSGGSSPISVIGGAAKVGGGSVY